MRPCLFLPWLLVACAPVDKEPTGTDTGAADHDSVPPDDTAPDDTAPDDTALDDTAPDDTAPDDTAPDDTDIVADADGDGVADVDDCDPEDADRGMDCTEGPVVAIAGARVLRESGDSWPYLLGGAELSTEGGQELALKAANDVLAVRIPEAGDVSISESVLGSVTMQGSSGSTTILLGDLDGDGWTDLVELVYTSAPVSDYHYEEFFHYTPTLVAYFGPLADGPAPAWETTLETIESSSIAYALLIDDLDGDGAAEVVFNVGSTTGYAGETAAWRLDTAGAAAQISASDGYTWGRNGDVSAVGDVDGDGIVDLSIQSDSRHVGSWAALHLGPLGDALPEDDAAEAILSGTFREVVPLGDLDGDGRDDVAYRGQSVWVVPGTWPTGDVDTLALARIGPEEDATGQSSLAVAGGDVGADGVCDLVITDRYWPGEHDTERRRGAVYVFHGMPSGEMDARAADARVYGAAEGDYFGERPAVLEDGRLTAQGYRDRFDAPGESWTAWILDGL